MSEGHGNYRSGLEGRPIGRMGFIRVVRTRLGRVRSAIGRVGLAIRDDSARSLTRNEKIGLTALVAVPALLTAIGLLSELTIPVPSTNDDALHFLVIQRASDALTNGESIFDFWLPQIEA